MQKWGMTQSGVKGHSIFVFDNHERDKVRFTDIIARPQAWSDRYYERNAKQGALDRIVDVPYFGDDREVVLLQLADFVAYFFRRYAEVVAGVGPRPYSNELRRLEAWVKQLAKQSLGRRFIY